jgi:hypothetical protein
MVRRDKVDVFRDVHAAVGEKLKKGAHAIAKAQHGK